VTQSGDSTPHRAQTKICAVWRVENRTVEGVMEQTIRFMDMVEDAICRLQTELKIMMTLYQKKVVSGLLYDHVDFETIKTHIAGL
jgi:hypothetical protein